MKVTSNVRNIYRNKHTLITWGTVPGGGEKIVPRDQGEPAGAQAAQPDTILQTWRSVPASGSWRPLGDITETRWTATPITWTSGSLPQGGTSLTATVELPEILSMVGCPTAIFFSIGIELGLAHTAQHSDWNCFVNVANLFSVSRLTNPGFLIRDQIAEFTGCVYGNLRKALKDTRISVTMNGFYTGTTGELTASDFIHFNVNGSAVGLQ